MCEYCCLTVEEVTERGLKDYRNLSGYCRTLRKKLRKFQQKFGGKVCTKCNLSKPFGDFPHHRKTYDGLDSWCKQCRREYSYECKRSLDSMVRVILRRIVDDRRGLEKDVDLEFLMQLWSAQEGKCAITGIPLEYKRVTRKHNAKNLSLDRIDSTKGYIKGNVQWVCWNVNRMKGEHSLDELKSWCKLLIAHQERIVNVKTYMA